MSPLVSGNRRRPSPSVHGDGQRHQLSRGFSEVGFPNELTYLASFGFSGVPFWNVTLFPSFQNLCPKNRQVNTFCFPPFVFLVLAFNNHIKASSKTRQNLYRKSS